MSTVAIILLNYNSTRLTKKCVQSLLAQKDSPDTYHTVIWDNASRNPPNVSEFEHCHVVLSETNYGFAEGSNKAVSWILQKEKNIDYILLLNNDTRVDKGMVRALIDRFEQEQNIGCVVPKIYFERGYEFHTSDYTKHEKGHVIWYAGGGIDWNNVLLFHKGVDEVDRGQFGVVCEQPFATGCCLLTTPAIWKKLAGFDPRLFMYYEDADFSLRLVRNLRKRIVLEPRAILYHLNAGSSGSGSDMQVYYQTRNRLRFGLQYAGVRTKLALLKEARRQFLSGTQAVRLGVLHALGGRWGKQHTALT